MLRLKTEGQPTPLEWLVNEMLNPENPKMLRCDCAKAAVPYLHRKQPQAIDGGENKPLTVMNLTKLPGLSNEKLDQLIGIATELADAGGDASGEGTTEAQPDGEVVSSDGGIAP